jgi:hypothetical protein
VEQDDGEPVPLATANEILTSNTHQFTTQQQPRPHQAIEAGGKQQ